MDLKRMSSLTGLGDGPDAKRAITADDDDLHLSQESTKDSNDEQPDNNLPLNVKQGTDFASRMAERERNLSPSSHVAPYTGNGCAPSLESFMFQQTPAGSQLCSWVSNTASQTSATDDNNGTVLFESDMDSKTNSQKDVKLNRKAMSNLRRQNALRALELERELASKTQQAPILLIRFPDPQINATSVSAFSGSIRDVVFPVNVEQRYCLVHLKVGANVERTIEEIKQVRFGQGYLHAELKTFTEEELADCIDPCSLYVSNIPFNMNAAEIKSFVNSMRVDIGVMKRQKRARYAFVRYATAEVAMEAFKDLVSRTLHNRVLTVRYRRLRKRPVKPTPAPLCATSDLTIDSVVTDDDGVECRVISPPPVESITIIDSDDEAQCGEQNINSSKPKKRDTNMTPQEREIQRLKQQVAEHGAIIRSLQKKDCSLVNAKVEPHGDVMTEKSSYIQRISPCSSFDIKMENDYLGINQSTPDHEPESLPDAQSNSPYRTTTRPLDELGETIKRKRLGRRKSTQSSANQQSLNKNTSKNSSNAVNAPNGLINADLEA